MLATPALLGTALVAGLTSPSFAAETTPSQLEAASDTSALQQVNAYSAEGAEMTADQVTSVSQLTDVRPTDWAFQALQSLVERYGCIVGYPDRTFRGNRALSRYEFAAGVNACMDRINELIAAGTADLARKEDLLALQQLQEQFAAELATLRGRVDALETRTTTLERQQFSTTTKLRGEVIFSLAASLGDSRALNSDQWRVIDSLPAGAARDAARAAAYGAAGEEIQDNPVFTDRVRLVLNTSFTGKDLLLTRLQARNTQAFSGAVTGTNMTRLSYDGNEGNSVIADKVFYRLPLGNLTLTVDAINGEFYNNVPTFNPFLASDSQGSISRFGRFNPIYRQGAGGAGVTANYKFSNQFSIAAGYLGIGSGTSSLGASDPSAKNGLFDGSYAALAQVAFKPTNAIDLGFTYLRSYNRGAISSNNPFAAATGSGFANSPFGSVATSGEHFGIQAAIKLSPGITLSGWGGLSQASAQVNRPFSATAAVNDGDDATIWNWAVALAFPDLGKKGNLGGIIFGMPPKVTSNDFGPATLGPISARREDSDTSYHLEGLYRFQLNNNISITPGVIVIFNPEHNSNNDTIYVGTLRTTFTF